MKKAWIKKTMTIVLAAVCVTAAVPASALAVSAEETGWISEGGEESGAVPQSEEQVPAIAETSAAAEQTVSVPEVSVVTEQTGTETAAAEQADAGKDPAASVPAADENAQGQNAQGQSAQGQSAQGQSAQEQSASDESVMKPEAGSAEDAGDPANAAEAAQDPAKAAEAAQDPADAEEEPEEAEEAEPEEELEAEEAEEPVVSYCTHVQTYGWETAWKENGDTSGTEGESKRLEGIRIQVSGVKDLGVEYCTHVQTIGWQDYVADGDKAGTEGLSKRLEAIRIHLTGAAAANYDIYYCVHVQTYGWLNWAKNDQMAGTAGYAKRLEGIKIMILPKGSPAPASVAGAVSSFLDNKGGSDIGFHKHQVIYNTHVQTYGWQDWVGDGAKAGTSGQSKRLEGMHIMLQNQDVSGSIEYCTHVQGIGWQDWVKDGALAGTTGQSRRLEALQIRLTGDMANTYDVWYRTHCQHYGWMGWTKNGEKSGTQGGSYRMEAVEIKLLPKGSDAPGSTANAFKAVTVYDLYPLASARLDQIGWDLRNAFIWSASMPYYRLPQDISYGARFFATYGFENGRGDCYVMAACFYEMAKALGYDAHWMFGYVPMAAGGLGIHSWVEVVINGATYICDPDYTHESGGNGYMITYGTGGWGYYNITRMN